MPSDHRLHPASVLFGVTSQARALLVPALIVLLTAGVSGGRGWELWALVLIVPHTIASLLRFVSFRYRYEAAEIVLKSGLIFRNERHVPYARIQNLDAVQGVLHRVLDVVEVRLDTGSGQEPEATLRVLTRADFEEMRRRVVEARSAQGAPAEGVEGTPRAAGHVLLHLPARELVLHGLIHNRGLVMLAAGAGILWEVGVTDRFTGRFFDRFPGGEPGNRDAVREFLERMSADALSIGQSWIAERIVTAALAVFVLVALVMLLSVAWALIRLWGFTLTRIGEDLRSEYGLLTRVTTTVPLRRVQTLTVQQGPLQRLFGRSAVRVETAGGRGGEEEAKRRELLAPLIRSGDVTALAAEVLPGLDLDRIEWRAVDPRAVRRKFRQSLILVALGTAVPAQWFGWWVLAGVPLLVVWAGVHARRYVQRLGWALDGEAVAFREGWVWRRTTVARFTRLQVVTILESPFDRRHRMATVRVDTAGAGAASHRVRIPYLPRDVAVEVGSTLGAQAAQTAFRW